jgi:recombination protein RecA
MAKKKDDNNIFTKLAKATKAEVLGNTTSVTYFIDTGNLAFNWSCSGRFMGGGVPGGRIIEFYGAEGSGKTYWGCNIVRGCQAIGGIPVYLDCENSLNNDWIVKTSHIDLDKVLVFGPSHVVDSLEGCFDKIYSTIRNLRAEDPNTPLVFVYDSLSASPSADELAETQKDWNPDKKEQPGVRARICSREFRKLNTLMEKTNCTLVVLNQTRLKIGVMYGNPVISAGGGESLKFYASLRVCTAVQKKIENKKLGTAMGINLKVRNVKNRCTAPFLEAEGVQLYWKDGVNPLSGLLTALIQSGRIEKAGNGTYVVKEPWAGGQDIKFRASKARNDIDAETLYKCPALVDAKDEQELRDYISIFGSAISQSQNEDNEETDTNDPSAGDDYE